MLERKKPEADLRKSYTVYMQIGLIFALLILGLLFNINLENETPLIIETVEQETVKMEEIEQTKHEVKPPPPPRPPVPVEVPNDEVIEEEILDLDAELDLDAPIDLPPPPPPAEEEEPEIFVVVEKRPEIRGGMKELYKHIKYPDIAKKAGIEGRVILEFVVDERGRVSGIKVLRGVEALNQAAISAVQKVKFTPGLQRGKPVKVRYTLPVTFKLTN